MEVKKIMVLGAGLMGRGVAQVSAQGGYETIMYDVSQKSLDDAMAVIKKNLEVGVSKGKFTAEKLEATLKNLTPTTNLKDGADAQCIIENVPEMQELKVEMYRKINEMCGEDTIIATNTSAISITELASTTKRPDKFIGMHFFNPVHIMRLVEVIRALETSDDTFQTIVEISTKMGKETVEVNDYPGFVTSRMNVVIGMEAFKMLEQGVASAEDIDKAIKLGLNHPMGPFEMSDLVGLDTRLKVCEYLHANLGENYRPSIIHRKYVRAGLLGRKTGKGIYSYEKK